MVASSTDFHPMPENGYGEFVAAYDCPATQRVLNEAWPLRDQVGAHASGTDSQPLPANVEVRIEWAADGEEWIRGRAWRWTSSHVFVRLSDSRSLTGFVWMRARDVRRLP